MATAGCVRANDWICPAYVSSDADAILAALRQHLVLTLASVALAVVIALPLALLVRQSRTGRLVALGVGGVVYTIPSLALFVLLGPVFGFTSSLPVVVALAAYNVQVLLRQVLVGLDQVPTEVREAAVGMGYGQLAMLRRVEFPLALPAVLAGLRLAAVSTVALVTVGAVIGSGGLGSLLYAGFQNDYHPQQLTALVLVVLLAVTFEVLLQGVERLATPWQRAARRSA